MNRNDKISEMFIKNRDEKREELAKKHGKKKENVIFASIPASRRVRK